MSRDWPIRAGKEPKAHALSQVIRASEGLMRAEVRAQQKMEQENQFAAAVSIVNRRRPSSSAITSRILKLNSNEQAGVVNEPIMRPFLPRLAIRPRTATRNNVLEKRPIDFYDPTYVHTYEKRRFDDVERHHYEESRSLPLTQDDAAMSQSLIMLDQYLYDEQAKLYVHVPSGLHIEMDGSLLAAKSTASPSLHSMSRVLSQAAARPAQTLMHHLQQHQSPPKLQKQSSYRNNASKKSLK